MDHEFDKEIDALLRKAKTGGPVLVGDFSGSPHIDADGISAFAENAVAEKSRALYARHLADCDRCRTILADTLALNAEAAPAAASLPSAITIAEREMPWYQSLFAFRNLAYVMGGLVLIFGGFLAFTIVQNSNQSEVAMAPAMESERTKGGPNFQDEPSFAANSTNAAANSAANVMDASANANSNSAVERETTAGARGPLADEARGVDTFTTDGVSATQPSAAAKPQTAAPPPPAALAAPKDATDRDDAPKEKAELKVASNQPPAKTDTLAKQRTGAVASQSGPMQNNTQYNRQLENMDSRLERKRAEDAEESSGRRVIGSRTFEKKQGVWYDTNFAGTRTINVRRGTAEFRRLDGGLRSIANSLTGTVVVVWNSKAYRIQ